MDITGRSYWLTTWFINTSSKAHTQGRYVYFDLEKHKRNFHYSFGGKSENF